MDAHEISCPQTLPPYHFQLVIDDSVEVFVDEMKEMKSSGPESVLKVREKAFHPGGKQ